MSTERGEGTGKKSRENRAFNRISLLPHVRSGGPRVLRSISQFKKGTDSRRENEIPTEVSPPDQIRNNELVVVDTKRYLYRSGIAMSNWGEVGNALISLRTGRSDLPEYRGIGTTKATYEPIVNSSQVRTATSLKDEPADLRTQKLQQTQVFRTDAAPSLEVVQVDPLVQNLRKGSRPYERVVETEPKTQTKFAITSIPTDNALLFEVLDQPGTERKVVEKMLAARMHKEDARGHDRRDVYVVIDPQSDHVSIDFNQVVERLDPILNKHKERGAQVRSALTRLKEKKSFGERIANYFTAIDAHGNPNTTSITPGDPLMHPFKLGIVDGLEISLSVAMVGDRFVREPGFEEARDRWNAKGSVLTMPFKEHPEGVDYIYPPILVVSIHRPNFEVSGRTHIVPVVDQQAKVKMRDLSISIQKAFSTSKK